MPDIYIANALGCGEVRFKKIRCMLLCLPRVPVDPYIFIFGCAFREKFGSLNITLFILYFFFFKSIWNVQLVAYRSWKAGGTRPCVRKAPRVDRWPRIERKCFRSSESFCCCRCWLFSSSGYNSVRAFERRGKLHSRRLYLGIGSFSRMSLLGRVRLLGFRLGTTRANAMPI